jgi:hypothetical protein
MITASVSLLRVAKTINPGAAGSARDPNKPACVETYGITLNLSEYYVREFAAVKPTNTPELSTVVKGMAHNLCGEDLSNVHLKFEVHDDGGHKGDGYYLIEKLAAGQAAPFEKAWMGRVVSYEVTADR